MPEKHLLLPSAKAAVLVPTVLTRRQRLLRAAGIGVGALCVLVGAADLSSRAAAGLGADATFLALGPAAAMGTNPLNPAPASSEGVVTPSRLSIPSLGIAAAVESVGVKSDGSMGTPAEYANVAWYSLGGKPGQGGSAVFAGHVNNGRMLPGVFAHLDRIRTGDYVTVSDTAGRRKVYRVQEVTLYEADASTEPIFRATGAEQLVLITCDGAWVPSARTFDKRLVVIATPAY